MKCPKIIASAALFSLMSANDLPDTSRFYLYDQTTPTIAVIDFHNQGISSAAGQTLTDRFRLTLSLYTKNYHGELMQALQESINQDILILHYILMPEVIKSQMI